MTSPKYTVDIGDGKNFSKEVINTILIVITTQCEIISAASLIYFQIQKYKHKSKSGEVEDHKLRDLNE